MRALVRPALAVLVVTGLGVASARRVGRDELAQPCDRAALCAEAGLDTCGKAPTHAPPALAIVDRACADPAVVVVETAALAPTAVAPRARAILADAPKTSPPV